jgi:hypothetical protein
MDRRCLFSLFFSTGDALPEVTNEKKVKAWPNHDVRDTQKSYQIEGPCFFNGLC